jgi:DNA repair exonuclease SbcCD ATPase subunit
MKIAYMTAAQCLLFLAACLTAAAQADVNPDRYPDEASATSSASAQETQIRTLQAQLESYQRELRAKAESVEAAQQEAIAAGIQGDFAGAFIDVYMEQQKELDRVQATLTPQIERTRALIASLTNPVSPEDSSSQVRALQGQLERYQQELRAKAELVESLRQEAISAGIQGDGAGPYIDAYRQEEKEMEALQAALAPQIERTRALIASLASPVSPVDSSLSQAQTPARPASAVVAGGNSHERKQTGNRVMASHDSLKLHAAAR